MGNAKGLEDYVKLPTAFQDLEIYVKDLGALRKVCIKGNHVMPGGPYNCLYSELETQLSLHTLTKISLRKGRYFRDEIERSENPNYLKRKLEILLKEFIIVLSHKKMLDFGCGAGASTLNFLRCGATNITGVDVDETLLDIANSRLNDFFQNGYKLIKIEYIDGRYSMPFSNGEFDISYVTFQTDKGVISDYELIYAPPEKGDTITFTHDPLTDFPGKTQYAQLVPTVGRVAKDKTALDPCMVIDNEGLDKFYPYPSHGNKATDNPGVPVTMAYDLDIIVKYNFKMYLMYKPDREGAIFVPLKRLDWHWFGIAKRQKVSDNFNVTGSEVRAGTQDKVADEFPEWKEILNESTR